MDCVVRLPRSFPSILHFVKNQNLEAGRPGNEAMKLALPGTVDNIPKHVCLYKFKGAVLQTKRVSLFVHLSPVFVFSGC